MRWALFTLLLFGCMVGPNYQEPEILTSQNWVEDASLLEPPTEWWSLFEDSLLTECIEKATLQNKDLLMAESRILRAIAFKQVAASSLFPQISSDLNATKTYFSKNGPIFSIGPAEASLPGSGGDTGIPFAIQAPQMQNLYNVFFNISWQLDLFGKTRREVEAAKAAIEASIEEKNGILLTVISEVAQNYIELRTYQLLTLLLEEEAKLLEKKKEILKSNFETGYANLMDYEQAEIDLLNLQAQIPDLIANVYRSIYAISTLTGSFPEELLPTLLPFQTLPSIPPEINVGIRSDVLRRRPDVRFAERKLREATANVGVSVASFFPSMTLLGDLGLQSLSLGNLFDWKSKTWAYGGDVLTPVFKGGELFGNLRASRAAQTEAAAFYERTVLQALFEAEKFLVQMKESLQAYQKLSKSLEKTDHLLYIATQSFEQGLYSQLLLINAQRASLISQATKTKSQAQSLSEIISLYKALGGGWGEPKN